MAPPVTKPPLTPSPETAAVTGPAPPGRARPLPIELALLTASLTFAVAIGLTCRTGSAAYGVVALAAAVIAHRLWR